MKNLLLLFSVLFILCIKITEAQQTPTFANPPGPEHVLVVFNSKSDTSMMVMNYYKDARNIPAINIVALDSLDTLTTVTYNDTTHTIYLDQQGEIIRDMNNKDLPTPTLHAWIYFNEKIAIPIANYLETHFVNGTPLKDIIRFIVLCKGVPFRIDARQEDADSKGTNVICANLLTHLGETMEDPDALLFYYNKTPGISNPYFNADPTFSMEHHFIPNHYQTTWQGRTIKLSYLVSHLSAPRFEDIQGMIDRSVEAINASDYTWLIDLDPTPCRSVLSGDPESAFINLGITNYLFDLTDQIYTSFEDSIMSYCSNGTWTSIGDSCNNMAFNSDYIQSQLSFDYAAGAFFSSIESHNGLSIGTYPVIRTRGQGLIADFTLMGGTVAVGQAFHSTGSHIIRNDIFFPSYAVGYSFIEAAYLGLQKLDATNVVVGDPLTRVYNCPETIITTNTTIGDGDYNCDIVVEENATLTIDAGSTLNFNRNAKLLVYGTLELRNGATLNFNKYSRLYLEGTLAMVGTSAYLNFNDESVFKVNNISIDNSISMNFNDESDFYINENGTLITYPENSFTFNDNSKLYVDGKLIVNEGNSFFFNSSSSMVVSNKIYFNAGSEINFNDNSFLYVFGTFISKGQSEINDVVFNFSGTTAHQLSISNPDTVLIDFTTFNQNGLELVIDQAVAVKHISITNSFFESAHNPLYIACKNVIIEEPITISNCNLNNCSGTGISIIQVPEITIENCNINLVSPLLPHKGIVLKNNGVVDIIACNITGGGIGIESLVSREDDFEIIEELETNILISQCIFENLTTGILIDDQVAPYNSVDIYANHFDNCKYGIAIDEFFDYSPDISENILSGGIDGYAEYGIVLTNGNEVVISNNSITNFLTGISLNIVSTPYILENTISAIDKTVAPLSGIVAVSSHGQIRKNIIRFHKTGLELGSASPKIGANIITDNDQYGIYISSNSKPDLSEAFIGEEQYPLSGYNTIRENGLCNLINFSELYLVKSTVNLLKGCNTIADDREEPLHCGYYYLIDGKGVRGEINAIRNYWGELNGSNPEGRFGDGIMINYEDWLDEPCTYGEGGIGILLADSKGAVYDTIYSTGNVANGLTDIESRYSTANEYYYTNQYSQAKQEYEGIIQNYGNSNGSLQAYNRLYTIANLISSTQAEFNQLKDFYMQKAGNQTDSLMIGTLTHLGNLCLVSAEEYLPAINTFDQIAQQNPNTDIALYRQIDALTTSLLVPQDSTLNKGILGKYSVNSLSDYTNKLSELLKSRGKSGIESEKELIPTEYTLYQNYPNPFNPTTTIKYDLPNTSDVSLIIYDILGRKVKELVNTKQLAGRYEVQFDASNLASGVYIYQLVAEKYMQSRKMILLK